MDIKNLTNDELIQLFEEKECNLKRIESEFGLGKNAAGRLYTKRGIDYDRVKKEWLQQLKIDYENNPKVCKHCGKPIPYEDKNKKEFCNRSCAASYNNLQRSTTKERNTHCLNCGKELPKTAVKYCDNHCKGEYEYKQYIERWKKGQETGTVGKYDICVRVKRYLFEKFNNKCQLCGWDKVHPITGNVPLQVHHIDGDCLNNKEENLQLLCPNCHSLTGTYGSLNENSSRVYRKQKGNI